MCGLLGSGACTVCSQGVHYNRLPQGLRPREWMETPPQDGGVDLKEVRPGESELVRFRGDDTLSTLGFPHTFEGMYWAACHG